MSRTFLLLTPLFAIIDRFFEDGEQLPSALTLSSFLILLVGGLLTGTLGALLGLGGGVFLIPFLVFAFNLPMHQAIATSIVAVIATSSAGAAMNIERQTVNIRLGMVLEIATVTGAILGGLTANRLSNDVLAKIFATLLLIVAVVMIRRNSRKGQEPAPTLDGVLAGNYVDGSTGETIRYTVHRIPGLLGISVIAGNISGLLGVGGGIFKVPAMNLVSGVPMKAATATSNFMIGVTAAASAFIYFAHGHLNPVIGATAGLGVLGGSFLGVRLARKVHTKVLTWIFAAVLLVVSAQLYLR
ncbi:MAG TPA: sulfite exporter TauE/SafE family protein [Bacteroidota bacterium]|nr:sulfite exporter TauE/SafE family protein [Bacteroidota bacterium]